MTPVLRRDQPFVAEPAVCMLSELPPHVVVTPVKWRCQTEGYETDWALKESVRATIRTKVRRLLAKYDHPPDLEERAVELVLAILRPEDQPQPVATTSKKKVTIRPLVRPELDVEKIATALVELAKSLPKDKRDELAKEGQEMMERMNKDKKRAA